MRRLALTLVVVSLWLASGCRQSTEPAGGKGTDSTSGSKKRGTLGVSVLTLTNPTNGSSLGKRSAVGVGSVIGNVSWLWKPGIACASPSANG